MSTKKQLTQPNIAEWNIDSREKAIFQSIIDTSKLVRHEVSSTPFQTWEKWIYLFDNQVIGDAIHIEIHRDLNHLVENFYEDNEK